MADTQLILHVKGTAEQTTALPKQTVRAGIAQGQITYSQLIWSPIHSAWKQVRELPHLWPSQKMAPAPRVAVTAPMPRVPAAAPVPSVPTPRVAITPTPKIQGPAKIAVVAAQGQPRVVPRAQGSATPVPAIAPQPQAAVHVAPRSSVVVEDDDDLGPRWAKWIAIGLGVVLAAAIGANYLLVDQPLVTHLGETPFSKISVYAHLGALIQPGDIVIHIPGSSALNQGNFAAFLVALAHSTPMRPVRGDAFDRVSLTSGWTGRYSFDGQAWQELGGMAAEDEQARQNFILNHLDDASGQPVAGTTTDTGVREKAWEGFVADFARP